VKLTKSKSAGRGWSRVVEDKIKTGNLRRTPERPHDFSDVEGQTHQMDNSVLHVGKYPKEKRGKVSRSPAKWRASPSPPPSARHPRNPRRKKKETSAGKNDQPLGTTLRGNSSPETKQGVQISKERKESRSTHLKDPARSQAARRLAQKLDEFRPQSRLDVDLRPAKLQN